MNLSRQWKLNDFVPHLDSTFEVWPKDTAAVPIELFEINDNSSSSLDSFSLLFKGKTGSVFRHDTYKVTHALMGELELFLGPIHTGKTDAVYYQAIFSALRNV